MADYTVVERVSRALVAILTEGLRAVDRADPPTAVLHHLQPPPGGQARVLTVFLYEVCADHTVRNREPEQVLLADGRYRIRRAPMPLVLHYLVTPWANDPRTEHLMLGRTVQVLYERQIHQGADLDPALDLPVLSIALAPLSLEERTRVWWSIQQPYRLSLNYEVRVVDVDVSDEVAGTAAPVEERRLVGEVGVG